MPNYQNILLVTISSLLYNKLQIGVKGLTMPLESIAVTFRKGDIMSYTALYRKFRPSTFDQVKGQDHIVQTLKNQINANRIGHAYLFCGTRGTGKTSVAKIFAKAVNCEHPVDGSPCNECETCQWNNPMEVP